MPTTDHDHELMNRVSYCLANVSKLSHNIGGISKLSQKLVKRSRKCRTTNLTPDEALLLSWALGTCVNLQLAMFDEGLQELKASTNATRDAFQSYTEAHQQAPAETGKGKKGKRSGGKMKGRGL